MVYASGFNLFIRAMEIAVLFFGAVSILLGVVLVVLRRRNQSIFRHRADLQQRWQKTFRTTFTTPLTEFPPILKNDRYDVLLVFNQVRQLRQSDRDSDRDGRTAYGATLNEMARRIGLDAYALTLLDRKDDADKIAALNTLCWLGDARLIPTVRNLMKTARSSLSRAAAEALLRLDPASVEEVVVQVRDRFGYVRARVELMLREVGMARLDPAMARVIATSDDRGKMRLLDYLSCASPSAARQICRDIATSANGELVAAALKTLATVADPEDADVGRRFAADDRPFLRLAALRVLKETAAAQDLELLERMTSDSSWWVRQRAAEALVAIDTGNQIATRVLEAHEDPYARAAVTAALASQRAAVNGVRSTDRRADTRERSRR